MAITAETIPNREGDVYLEAYNASLRDHQAVIRREITRLDGERPKLTDMVVENLRSEVEMLSGFMKEGCLEGRNLHYVQVENPQVLRAQAASMPECVEHEYGNDYAQITVPMHRVAAVSGRIVQPDLHEPYAFSPIIDMRIPHYDIQQLEQSVSEEMAAAGEKRPFIRKARLAERAGYRRGIPPKQWFTFNLMTGQFFVS